MGNFGNKTTSRHGMEAVLTQLDRPLDFEKENQGKRFGKIYI
jgi:hypothetical protein